MLTSRRDGAFARHLAVAFTCSIVIVLIADLDRSQEGVLKVSQQALIELRQSMRSAPMAMAPPISGKSFPSK